MDKVKGVEVEMPDAKGVEMKVLISPAEGWDGWVMREFILEPGGNTPRHIHDWPHINYIHEGEGTLFLKGEEHALVPGAFAYVPAGAEHQFRNTGTGKFRFMCIIPKKD